MHKETPSSVRLVELDALRGIAAMAVVAYHYTTHYANQIGHLTRLRFGFPAGNYGVHLFFLISGFVIFMTLERTRNATDFVVSRFSRLYPAYWMALLVTAAVVYTIGMPEQRLPAWDLLLNLTMLQQILGAEHLDGSYWTLQVELFFYAQMLFWFMVGGLKRIHWVVAAWLVLAVLYREVELHHLHFSYLAREVLILRHIPFFALGILFYRLRTQPGERLLNWAMVGLCLVAIAIIHPPVYLLAAVVCCALFTLFINDRLRKLQGGFFVYLGAISYPLYLLHQAIGFAVINRLEHAGVPSIGAVLLATVLVMALATGLAYWVERPAMRWLRTRWHQRKLRMGLA